MDQISPILRIGARGSPLSLAQTRHVRAQLAAALHIADADIDNALPITPIVTTGDRITDRALLAAGGKGLFTKELDEALLDGRIDCAIHSAKDVPNILPDAIVLLAHPVRENPADVLITRDGCAIDGLAQGALVGSASVRRQAQLSALRPDLRFDLLRGNVGTRLSAIAEGRFDATLLAFSGLNRLGLLGPIEDDGSHGILGMDVRARVVDVAQMVPAAAQGCLAITARADAPHIHDIWAKIACNAATLEAQAERACLLQLDGSCRTPIGILARLHGDTLTLTAEIYSETGVRRATESLNLGPDAPPDATKVARFGQDLGRRLLP